jgi:hypothetical protein
MRVAEVCALHPDAQGEVVKRWHLNLVPQELKCRDVNRCKHEAQMAKSPKGANNFITYTSNQNELRSLRATISDAN